MDSPVMVLYLLAAVSGLVALEMRQARASLIAIGAAFVLFAVGMFVAGAVEVGVGALVGGAALVAVLHWGFTRTSGEDTLPRLPQGSSAVLAAVALVAFVVVVALTARALPAGTAPAGAGEGGHVGLLREALVILAALAGIWAMLRKSGRRDE
jgi:hypothetical protein